MAPPRSGEIKGGVLVEDLEGSRQELDQLAEAGTEFILVFRPGCSACKRLLRRLEKSRSTAKYIGLAAVSRSYLEKYLAEAAPDFPLYFTTEKRLSQAGVRLTPALLIWCEDHWRVEYDSDIIIKSLRGTSTGGR
jgi:hypothetical protein